MSDFNSYCETLGISFSSDIIKRVEDSLTSDNESDTDSAIINKLVMCYCDEHSIDTIFVAALPVPFSIINECNLHCIYTINDVVKHNQVLSEKAKKYLDPYCAVA